MVVSCSWNRTTSHIPFHFQFCSWGKYYLIWIFKVSLNFKHPVMWWMKAGISETEDAAVGANGQWTHARINKHVSYLSATAHLTRHATVEELLAAAFSLRSVPRSYSDYAGNFRADTHFLKLQRLQNRSSSHHWCISKVHTGPRVARGFPSAIYLWLHNEIVQATSKGHIKSQKWKFSRQMTDPSSHQRGRPTSTKPQLTVTKIWSLAPDEAWLQDWPAVRPSVVTWLWLWSHCTTPSVVRQ
jgi:hypothetical protein